MECDGHVQNDSPAGLATFGIILTGRLSLKNVRPVLSMPPLETSRLRMSWRPQDLLSALSIGKEVWEERYVVRPPYRLGRTYERGPLLILHGAPRY